MKVVHVAVGVIARGDEIFITLRPDNVHQGGKWEFPGGKREANETIERCLHRELKEELGIEVALGQALESVTHKYSVMTLQITFFLARLAKGEPRAIECAGLEWVTRENLAKFQFPPADQRLISRLVDDHSFWE